MRRRRGRRPGQRRRGPSRCRVRRSRAFCGCRGRFRGLWGLCGLGRVRARPRLCSRVRAHDQRALVQSAAVLNRTAHARRRPPPAVLFGCHSGQGLCRHQPGRPRGCALARLVPLAGLICPHGQAAVRAVVDVRARTGPGLGSCLRLVSGSARGRGGGQGRDARPGDGYSQQDGLPELRTLQEVACPLWALGSMSAECSILALEFFIPRAWAFSILGCVHGTLNCQIYF
ncbi:uncharacterized protein V1510DRAFT_422602 [Dipodascopsis tothii]|uniref:uncharacterized protein n=1 Tax=Dipodascopsis tothii TaxID=44089 RepID=UPI0034CF609F